MTDPDPTRAALAGIFRVALGELDEQRRAVVLAALVVLGKSGVPKPQLRAALEAAAPLHAMVSELLEQTADLHAECIEQLEHEAGVQLRQPVTA